MKNKFILLISFMFFLSTIPAEAKELSREFSGLNIKMPEAVVNNNVKKKNTVNKSAMKAQIDAINSKVNSVSSNYLSCVDNLANNLLSKEQLNKYNEDKDDLKKIPQNTIPLNLKRAENGVLSLNRFLKLTILTDTFKNLTIAQKSAIKRDLKMLKNVSNSYIQIAEQSKILTKQIKSDPAVELELKSDLSALTKNEAKINKQIKFITRLTNNITNLAVKSGYSL